MHVAYSGLKIWKEKDDKKTEAKYKDKIIKKERDENDYESNLVLHVCKEYDPPDGIDQIKATLDGKFLMVGFGKCVKFFRVDAEDMKLWDLSVFSVSKVFLIIL